MINAYIVASLVAYLIGAIPFSFLIAKMWGIDIRKIGSGNIGATNVARNAGAVAGTLAYVLDIGKGMLAAYFVSLLQKDHIADSQMGLLLIPYLMPIIGHTFPVYLGFKGGKGVAVSAGVFLFLIPIPLLLVVSLFLIVFFSSKMISLASLTSAFFLPVFFALHQYSVSEGWIKGFFAFRSTLAENGFYYLFSLVFVIAAFIFYLHRGNIKRLLNGTEYRFGKKNKEKS